MKAQLNLNFLRNAIAIMILEIVKILKEEFPLRCYFQQSDFWTDIIKGSIRPQRC